ncbi:MAG: hypothetical protein KIT30_01645 [Cyclobacteriaceae bacterium]|nr:hypothetical protein [Cyclobacteriaceae bacterium]
MKIRVHYLIMAAPILLLACAEEGEVAQSQRHKWVYYDKGDGLASNRVLALYEDNSNRIWIGTDQGVDVYTGSSFVHYSVANGLVSNVVNAIASDNDGIIWAGTDNGLNLLIDGDWYYALFFDGAVVTSLLRLHNGNMVVGTRGGGAYEYRNSPTPFEYYRSTTCADCNDINVLYESKPNEVWIGTEGGLKRKAGNTITSYTTLQGLPDNHIRAITQDNWGNIWIGTLYGSQISRFTKGKWENIDLANLYVQSWVGDLEVDNNGTLWISTFVGGIHHYDGAVVRKDFENFPDESITTLLKDVEGNIWVGTFSSGLAKFTP